MPKVYVRHVFIQGEEQAQDLGAGQLGGIAINLPKFDGWHLIGQFPDNEPNDVGSWLLFNKGHALLLELPEGLPVGDVTDSLENLGVWLKYITVSHTHEDHFDTEVLEDLRANGCLASMLLRGASNYIEDYLITLGGEPLWLVKAPKHSMTDIVTVFRGVAMTGDIELGTLESVNNEVPPAIKINSMKWLQEFQDRQDYHIHSVVSAHLNDVRLNVDWPKLFEY